MFCFLLKKKNIFVINIIIVFMHFFNLYFFFVFIRDLLVWIKAHVAKVSATT